MKERGDEGRSCVFVRGGGGGGEGGERERERGVLLLSFNNQMLTFAKDPVILIYIHEHTCECRVLI